MTNPAAGAVTVRWGVACPSTGFVEYGDTPDLGNTAHGLVDGLRPYDDTVIAVRVAGLKPGARVYYRTVTEPIRFRTHSDVKHGQAV